MSKADRTKRSVQRRPGSAPARRPGSRGPLATFSRHDVLDVARRLPAEKLTMAGISAELGVSTAAVYRYFPDRAAVLHALLADGRRMLKPPSRRLSWRRWLQESADTERAFWRAHPEFQEVVHRLLLTDATEAWVETGIAVMTRDGFSAEDAVIAISSISMSASSIAMIDNSWEAAAEQIPDLERMLGTPLQRLRTTSLDAIFQQSVDLILDGLRSRRHASDGGSTV